MFTELPEPAWRRSTVEDDADAFDPERAVEAGEIIGIAGEHAMIARARAQDHGGVDDVGRACRAAELAGGTCARIVQGLDLDETDAGIAIAPPVPSATNARSRETRATGRRPIGSGSVAHHNSSCFIPLTPS